MASRNRFPRTAALLAGLVTLACSDPAPEHRSVLLITVDTLRADHVSAYGYARPTTPNVDRLAARGVRFENAVAPQPKTAPSLASLHTGLFPRDHGVRTNFMPLATVRLLPDLAGGWRPDPTTPDLLAERLAGQGISTGAFVSNYVLTAARSGLARGFATYDDELTSAERNRPSVRERKAKDSTDRALSWLARHHEEPFFLWVHYIDPHGAYEPPSEFDRFAGGPGGPAVPDVEPDELRTGPDGRRLYVAHHNLVEEDGHPVRDLGRYVELYDGEILYVDAEIGRLLDGLERLDLDDDTLVVFTADHGESLGEHSLWFEHGYYLFEPSLRIPLVVRAPGIPGGRVVSMPVSLIDLRPTLEEWFGLAPTPGLPGTSLIAPLSGAPGDPGRTVFAERAEFGFLMRAARSADWKLIHNVHDPDPASWPLPGEFELYDLTTDPLETQDLWSSPDEGPRRAREQLGAALARWSEEAGEPAVGGAADAERLAALPEEDRLRLQAMGYGGDDPARDEREIEPRSPARERPADADPRALLTWALSGERELRTIALEGLVRAGWVQPETCAEPGWPLDLRLRATELHGDRDVPEIGEEAEASVRLARSFAAARQGASANARDALRDALEDGNPGIRAAAAWYLGRLRDPASLPALRSASDDAVLPVRVEALRARVTCGDQDATGVLEALARSENPEVMRAACLALGELLPAPALQTLVADLMRRPGEQARATGLELAARLDPAGLIGRLDELSADLPLLRRRLVHALGAVEAPEVEPFLRRALADPDDEIAVLAAAHLARRVVH